MWDLEEYSIETLYELSELFKVFGDTTRIRILTALRGEPLCVFHLAQKLEMGQSAISHQLRLLRNAGLVRARRAGKNVSYALDDDHVAQIIDIGLAHVLHGPAGKEAQAHE